MESVNGTAMLTLRASAALLAVLCLVAAGCARTGSSVREQVQPRKFPPMVLDKATGHYKDMSYEALSDEGLSWEEKTRLFGGETATYGPLTRRQRKAKEKELKELLARIDMKLVNRCEADVRAWLDWQAAAPLKRPGWEKNWKLDWSVYTKVSMWPVGIGAVCFFRAYEMWGDEKYLEAGLKRADIFVKAQYPQGPYRMHNNVFRIQDKWQDWPWSIVMYAYKHSKDKKYLESAKKCADVLLKVQRADSGGWPDQWVFPGGRAGSSGVIHGTSHNDCATTSPFVMMVMMYHLTGDAKYVANLHKLGKHIEDANLGVGDVVGWAEQYGDNAKPTRARQYEIEICYPSSVSRSMGPLLTWLYLMDGNEKHMELMKRAYNSLEKLRQKDLAPENWKCWKTLKDAGGRGAWYHPGFPHAFLPDASNSGSVLGYRMHPVYPVTEEQRKKWGHFIHGNTGGDLYHWGKDAQTAKTAPAKFAGAGPGNALCQVRRALLEHKRGGYDGLLRYFTGPTKYTPDQYLQARVDAAKRALDPRNVRLASMGENDIQSEMKRVWPATSSFKAIGWAKIRWYGPKKSKWGRAYEDRAEDPARTACYKWQLVYDAMIAQGKIDADTAARGGRGMEQWFSSMSHLDSWDVIGPSDNHVVEVENHFDVPIKGKKK